MDAPLPPEEQTPAPVAPEPPPPDPRRHAGMVAFAAAAVAVAVFLLVAIRLRPPAPAPSSAPPTSFSAERAQTAFRDVLRDVPRPLGSAEHEAARERLVAHLKGLGLDPAVERHWSVSRRDGCAAWVSNVTARIVGREPGPEIVLSTHYDSVPAGPGASDAGMCVAAVLETARALRASPPLRRTVLLLFTDGEELGLLGARAHVAARGTADTFAVVNLDARGTTGPSLMFETGPASSWSVADWKRLAPQPVTSSIFPPVYRGLPNGTDLTAFLDAGVPGLNFACIGGVRRYHTPRDDFEHLDLRTLQHHGDNALAAVRAFADAAPPPAEPEASVWADLYAAAVAGVAERRIPRHAQIGLGLLVLACILRWARDEVRTGEFVAGMAGAIATILLGTCGATLVALGVRAAGGLPDAYPPSSAPMLVAAAGAALAVAGAVSRALHAWSRPAPAFLGTWVFLAVVAVWSARAVPPASYLFVLPLLAAGLVAAGAAVVRNSLIVAETCVGVLAAATLWFPLSLLLADGVGVADVRIGAIPVAPAAVPFVVVATVLVPALAGSVRASMLAVAAGVAAALGGAVVQIASDDASPDAPRPLTFVWTQEQGDPHAHWFAVAPGADVPEPVRAAHPWDGETSRVVPWDDERGVSTEAPSAPVPAPLVTEQRVRESDGGRRVRFRLVSQRGASRIVLAMAPDTRLRRFSANGAEIGPESVRDATHGYVMTFAGVPREGVEIELDVASPAQVEAIVADVTWGLPPWASAVAKSRPADRVPVHLGDRAVVHRRVKL